MYKMKVITAQLYIPCWISVIPSLIKMSIQSYDTVGLCK